MWFLGVGEAILGSHPRSYYIFVVVVFSFFPWISYCWNCITHSLYFLKFYSPSVSRTEKGNFGKNHELVSKDGNSKCFIWFYFSVNVLRKEVYLLNVGELLLSGITSLKFIGIWVENLKSTKMLIRKLCENLKITFKQLLF